MSKKAPAKSTLLESSSSSSSSSSSLSNPYSPISDIMCNIYLDDLLVKFVDIDPRDPCPYCEWQIMIHNRKPLSHPSPSSSASVPPASVQLDSSVSKPRMSFDKVVSKLPKWDKKSVCRTYLQRITQIMQTSGIEQKEWIHAFPLVVEEVSTSQWIITNITEQANMTWTHACKLFTEHFQSSD